MKKLIAVVTALFLVVGVSNSATAANPYDKKWSTFSTVTLTGVGDDVVDLPKSFKAGIVTATHQGTANFIVWSLNNNLEKSELVVNVIGAYSADRAFGLGWRGSATSGFEVKADGEWTLTLRPFSQAVNLPTLGSGPGVYKASIAKRASWRFSHDGSANFIVWQYCTGGGDSLLINKIGTYNGKSVVAKGTCLFIITADGLWAISKK